MKPAVFAVLGAGSWGTALAIRLADNGHRIRLWGRDPAAMRDMQGTRRNQRYLPNHPLPDTLTAVSDLTEALDQTDFILIAIPTAGFRILLREVRSISLPSSGLIWATKGLELPAGKPLHEVLHEELPAATPRALLSGPSFAGEVAAGKPTAVTLASNDADFAARAAACFHRGNLRVYTSTDVIGVELGGALKNVMAIAAGISDGLGFGANGRAALITRGLHEITQLGLRAGARAETLAGLSGLGDLVLTCTDDQSRNRRLGLALARGNSCEDAVRAIGQAVEGMETARVVRALAATHGVEMPICSQVHRILHEGLDARKAVGELLARGARAEHH